ncbi:MAG TPA: S8 family serine peptidase, partial [Chloroflexia bacterium]|nr:S8 family serine peptidase [Chloroflexia bacterium]
AWRPGQGVCPACVQRALNTFEAAGVDLHRLLSHHGARSDNPAVAAYGLPALPVPLRLHANPLFRGAGVVLGMLDSGFYPHPDLTQPVDRIRTMVDIMAEPALEDADFSTPETRSWHGLMTSVVAAGNGYLSGGRYRGIASEAGLVLARVGQPTMRIPDRDIERGLRWMLANHARYGIRVLNVSLGGDEETDTATDPVDRLADALMAAGVMVVVAAGNSGRRSIVPPASAPSVLTVGGTSDQNLLNTHLDTFQLWRSSYGPTRSGHQKPELVAPSMLLAAPLLPGTRQAREAARLAALLKLGDAALLAGRDEARKALYLRGGALDAVPPAAIRELLAARMARQNWLSAAYQFVDGTSVAAPVVASIAVQMLEANPTLTPAALKELLSSTAVPMQAVPSQQQGRGVVNPALALALALRAPGGPMAGYPVSPHPEPTGGVTFYYYNSRVARVALVGDFNNWFAAGYAFSRPAPGIFTFHLPALPAGTYHYKFLLDDRTDVDDPESLAKDPDGYGGFSSRLVVA